MLLKAFFWPSSFMEWLTSPVSWSFLHILFCAVICEHNKLGVVIGSQPAVCNSLHNSVLLYYDIFVWCIDTLDHKKSFLVITACLITYDFQISEILDQFLKWFTGSSPQAPVLALSLAFFQEYQRQDLLLWFMPESHNRYVIQFEPTNINIKRSIKLFSPLWIKEREGVQMTLESQWERKREKVFSTCKAISYIVIRD